MRPLQRSAPFSAGRAASCGWLPVGLLLGCRASSPVLPHSSMPARTSQRPQPRRRHRRPPRRGPPAAAATRRRAPPRARPRASRAARPPHPTPTPGGGRPRSCWARRPTLPWPSGRKGQSSRGPACRRARPPRRRCCRRRPSAQRGRRPRAAAAAPRRRAPWRSGLCEGGIGGWVCGVRGPNAKGARRETGPQGRASRPAAALSLPLPPPRPRTLRAVVKRQLAAPGGPRAAAADAAAEAAALLHERDGDARVGERPRRAQACVAAADDGDRAGAVGGRRRHGRGRAARAGRGAWLRGRAPCERSRRWRGRGAAPQRGGRGGGRQRCQAHAGGAVGGREGAVGSVQIYLWTRFFARTARL
jgi:hypothetical protein